MAVYKTFLQKKTARRKTQRFINEHALRGKERCGMSKLVLGMLLLVPFVLAVHAPVSFYDSESRQNRPVWWIKSNPPSLFYSAERIEDLSERPLFIAGNAERLSGVQEVIKQRKGNPYSWAETRRLQGLNVLELGDVPGGEGAAALPRTTAVLGVASERFMWESRRGSERFKKPIGLVGLLSSKFSSPKNEMYESRPIEHATEGVLGASGEVFGEK